MAVAAPPAPPTGLEALSAGDRFFRKGLSGRSSSEIINGLGLIAILTGAITSSASNEILRATSMIIGIISAGLVAGAGAFLMIETLDNTHKNDQSWYQTLFGFLAGFFNFSLVGVTGVAAAVIGYGLTADSFVTTNNTLLGLTAGGWWLNELMNIILSSIARSRRPGGEPIFTPRFIVEVAAFILKTIGVALILSDAGTYQGGTATRTLNFVGVGIAGLGVLVNFGHGVYTVGRAAFGEAERRPPDYWTRWLGPGSRVTDEFMSLAIAAGVGLPILNSLINNSLWQSINMGLAVSASFFVIASGGWDFLRASHYLIYRQGQSPSRGWERFNGFALIFRGLAALIGAGFALAANVLLFLILAGVSLPSWRQDTLTMLVTALSAWLIAELINLLFNPARIFSAQRPAGRSLANIRYIALIGAEILLALGKIVAIIVLFSASRSSTGWENTTNAAAGLLTWVISIGLAIILALFFLRTNAWTVRNLFVAPQRPDDYTAPQLGGFLQAEQFDKVTFKQLEAHARRLRFDRDQFQQQVNQLQQQLLQANNDLATRTQERDQFQLERDQARNDLVTRTQERDQARQERDQARNDLVTRTQERDQARQERDTRTQERDQARNDLATRTRERDQARQERDTAQRDLQAERDAHAKTKAALKDCEEKLKKQ
ncbi:MAG: hypothetical protein DWB42_08125 [Chloroflexi bacterium]|nr:hypothetical protein [Chloroflexota bacterium]MDL1885572.1 hypothetical protein [Anaerolineae bacterium CFX8]